MCNTHASFLNGRSGRASDPFQIGLMVIISLGVIGLGAPARAQCTNAAKFTSTTVAGTGSAPANDTFFSLDPMNTTHSHAYVAQANAMFCFDNKSAGAKCTNWPMAGWTDSATLSNFPNPVVLSKDSNTMNNTAEYIYLGSQDGKLYKIDATNGNTTVTTDTRRGSCTSDQVVATPAVQLYRLSNAGFQASMDAKCGQANEDLVIVATHTMCSDSTHNRIIGYCSSATAMSGALKVAWTFNGNSAKKIDYISDGGSVDYTNNRYYFGTNLNSGVQQNTLWAISTVDGYDGAGGSGPVWSGNAGSIHNRPQFVYPTMAFPAGRVIAATVSGAIQAYDPAGDGGGNMSALWSSPGQMPGQVNRNIWYEIRSGAFQQHLLVFDTLGNLRAYNDTGSAANSLWTVQGNLAAFTSMPAVFPSQNKAYIGQANGHLIQVDLTHGGLGSEGIVASTSQTVGDPTVDSQLMNATDIDTVTATAANGVMAAITVNPTWSNTPCGAGSTPCTCAGAPNAPSSCASNTCNTNPCVTLNCVAVNKVSGVGHCAANGSWKADGTACNDGNTCTCDCANADGSGTCTMNAPNNDACYQGKCGAQTNICYSSCTCTNAGDFACGHNNPTVPNPGAGTCCGTANGGCVDLENDAANCGACGNSCVSGKCVGGVCRGTARCNFVTDTQLNNASANLTGADGLTFDNQMLAAMNGTCNAFLSSYRTTVDSPIYEVPSTAMATPPVTTIHNNTGSDHTPMHGISVNTEGTQAFGGLVNDHAKMTYSPELAISVVPAAYTKSGAAPAPARTADTDSGGAAGPFAVASFNAGPVGPAFDYVYYDANGKTDSKRIVYYANYLANGDLYKLDYSNGTSWAANALAGVTFTKRVNALAFGKRHSGDSANGHRELAVGTIETLAGSPHVVIRLVDLDNGNATNDCDGTSIVNSTLDCVDLSLWTPPMGDSETVPTKILSLAMHFTFGDFYAEVEDASNNVFVLNVDPGDLSPRRQKDVCDDQNVSGFPILIGTGTQFEGRIAITPDLNLMHIRPTVDGAPIFNAYRLFHQ